MNLILIGSLFLLIALICGINYHRLRSQLSEWVDTIGPSIESLSAGDAPVEIALQGEMECEEILLSPLSEQPCVAFEATVIEEWEDPNTTGPIRSRHRAIIAHDTESVPFLLNDGTGQVWVQPQQAEFDLMEVLHLFEPARARTSPLKVGNYTLPPQSPPSTVRKVIGYHFSEKIFPPEGYLYIQGPIHYHQGQWEMKAAPNHRLVISHQSHHELGPEAQLTAPLFLRIGWLSFLIGLGMYVAAWAGY